MDLITLAVANKFAKAYTDSQIGNVDFQNMSYYYCSSGEYNSSTGVPTIASPDINTFYIAPVVNNNGVYNIYIYKNNSWVLFHTCTLDLSELNSEITSIKQDLSEVTRNIFENSILTAPDVTVTDEYIYAQANVFNTRFGNGIPMTFDANTIYTFSGTVKTNGANGTTGTGLVIRIEYTDETYKRIEFLNSSTDWTDFSYTTTPGKSIDKVKIIYSSQGPNVWYLKDIQIEKASVQTKHIPHISAVDHQARNRQKGDYVKCSFLGYASHLGNAIPMVFDNGIVFMIDSFSVSAWDNVKADLTNRGISHLDYFMLTHWHDDHCGNIINLINNGYIDSKTFVYLPETLDTSVSSGLPSDWSTVVTNEANITAALTAAGITPIRPDEGDTVKIDECILEFWNTDHSVFYTGQAYPSKNYNDWSLCAYLTCGNVIICFTGDIGPIGQQKMADLGTMKKANIMTSPHHGWTNGTYANGYGLVPTFINAVSPDMVMTEDFSAHAAYIDTIKSPIQTWCQKNGVPHYRTYINGSMDVQIGINGWRMLGAYEAYVSYDSDWNWYDYQRELMMDAMIKSASYGYNKQYYASTFSGATGAGVLHTAIQAIVGSDDGTISYDVRIRFLDTGNSDAFCEAIFEGYAYTVATPTINYIRNRVISISARNNQGTIVMDGATGNIKCVIEVMKATALT